MLDSNLKVHPLQAFALKTSHLGVCICDTRTGEPLYQDQSHKHFNPASILKLFTAAAALNTLGSQFTVNTSLEASNCNQGVIQGPLVLTGQGDPFFNSKSIIQLVSQLVQSGITKIEGPILVDDSWLQGTQRFTHAEWEDLTFDYACEISALSFEDNALTYTLEPNLIAGKPPTISIAQHVPYYSLINEVITLDRIPPSMKPLRWNEDQPLYYSVQRDFTEPLLKFKGFVSLLDQPIQERVALPNPAEYTRLVLIDQLTRAGIQIVHPSSYPLIVERRKVLASLSSPPLPQWINLLNKESHNLTAELLIRLMGRQTNLEAPSFALQGLQVLEKLMEKLSFPVGSYLFQDGSGLSRQNLVTPFQVTTLLQEIYHSSTREVFIQSLPLAGKDGTLKNQFLEAPWEGNIQAKSGSLTHVNALAGYATLLNGREVTFCICLNQCLASPLESSQLIDDLLINIFKDLSC